MKRNLLTFALLVAPVIGCGSSSPEPVAPTDSAATPPPADTAATAAPTPAPTTPPKAEPTPEEKKKAEQAKKLAEDRAQMEAEAKTEAARWTPELRAEAKKLAETKYPTVDAALKAALAGKHRKPGNADRDKYRHPAETLKFLGLKPTMTVIEYNPGDGWYTELLAPTLAAQGKLLVAGFDPNGPRDVRSTLYGEMLKLFLDKSPELYGKVERLAVDPKKIQFNQEGTADMVLAFRVLHNMHRDKLMATFLAEVHKALKPNGVFAVEQHRAKADANPDDTAKQGYLPEAFVISQVEAAGFKLAGKSEVNANPKDTKDYAEGVWVLPPTLALGDKDKDKYAAIGESDRMTLKFVKVAAKGAAGAAAPAGGAGAAGGAGTAGATKK